MPVSGQSGIRDFASEQPRQLRIRQTFFAADDQKHGREALRDCIEAKSIFRPSTTRTRSESHLGGSYGGYMTLAALAFHPEEFHAGVDIFGVSNLGSYPEEYPPMVGSVP